MVEDAADLCAAMTLLGNKYNHENLRWMIRSSCDNTVPQQELIFRSLREPLGRINLRLGNSICQSLEIVSFGVTKATLVRFWTSFVTHQEQVLNIIS